MCAAAAWCTNSERPQWCFKKKCVVTQQGTGFDMQMLQDLKQRVGQGEEGGGAYQGQQASAREMPRKRGAAAARTVTAPRYLIRNIESNIDIRISLVGLRLRRLKTLADFGIPGESLLGKFLLCLGVMQKLHKPPLGSTIPVDSI